MKVKINNDHYNITLIDVRVKGAAGGLGLVAYLSVQKNDGKFQTMKRPVTTSESGRMFVAIAGAMVEI